MVAKTKNAPSSSGVFSDEISEKAEEKIVVTGTKPGLLPSGFQQMYKNTLIPKNGEL